MATLIELCESKVLEELDPGFGPEVMKMRCLYGTQEFVTWLDSVLPGYPSDPVHAHLDPMEQVAALFGHYVAGGKFSHDRRFKKLRRTPSLHIWELKTDDVRIFGWVPRKDAFVCCFGDLAKDIKVRDAYGTYMAKSFKVMSDIDLDQPKCIESAEYSYVISD